MPALRKRSLGTLMALHEIEWCKANQRRWLYLGFYVAACQKLAYKARFQPIEFYIINNGTALPLNKALPRNPHYAHGRQTD